jgi:hypothetical protein
LLIALAGLWIKYLGDWKCNPLFVVRVIAARRLNVCVPQGGHGGIKPEVLVDGATKFFAQCVQGFACIEALAPGLNVRFLADDLAPVSTAFRLHAPGVV